MTQIDLYPVETTTRDRASAVHPEKQGPPCRNHPLCRGRPPCRDQPGVSVRFLVWRWWSVRTRFTEPEPQPEPQPVPEQSRTPEPEPGARHKHTGSEMGSSLQPAQPQHPVRAQGAPVPELELPGRGAEPLRADARRGARHDRHARALGDAQRPLRPGRQALTAALHPILGYDTNFPGLIVVHPTD